LGKKFLHPQKYALPYTCAEGVCRAGAFSQQSIIRNREKHRPSAVQTESVAIVRDASHDAEYWQSMSEVVDEPKLKMWDALAESLTKYQ